ncbi:hypothetical protein KJ765_00745 [Candidatus Micrarchaeota archaeon]|nr:hypothetical protein [Candidatus Micrarchaeota archaeon]
MDYAQYADPLVSFASTIYAYGDAVLGSMGMTIAVLAIGMAVYAAIVGTFYTFLSRRVLFDVKDQKKTGVLGFLSKLTGIVGLIVNYTIIFPLIVFIWFVLLSSFLFFLSRTLTLETVFVLSLSVVSAIRILAYYKQEIAVDLSKMLPLALLGVLIVEPTLFSQTLFEDRLMQLLSALPRFAPFLLLVIGLEWTLRIGYAVSKIFVRKKDDASSPSE